MKMQKVLKTKMLKKYTKELNLVIAEIRYLEMKKETLSKIVKVIEAEKED